MRKILALLLALSLVTIILFACSTPATECKPIEDIATTAPNTTPTEEPSVPTVEDVIPEESTSPSLPTETEHPHVFVEERKEPTCVEDGKITKTCDCGHIEEEIIEAFGHTYKDEIIKPTYTTDGYTLHTCEVCGDETKDTYTDKIPHEHLYTEQITQPTCIAEGYTTHTCKLCGKTYKDSRTDKIPHTYTEKVVAPTCTSKGYTEYKCSCGNSYQNNETDKITHNFNNVKTVKPTCTADGYTLQQCSMCKAEKQIDKTAKIDHTFGSYKSDKNATCEKDGTKTAICSVCKLANTVADVGSKTGHELTDWENKDATHHTRYCSKDGCSFVEGEAHTYNIEKVVAPTCTARGYTEISCKCGRIGGKNNYTEAVGHAYSEKQTIAPTYTTEGYDLQKCSRCGHEHKTNVIPKVPHECTYKDTVTKPTCVDKGYTTHVCKICSDTKMDTYVDALGHDYKETVVTPTCTEKGYTRHTCSRCKDTYNDNEVAEIGHDYKTTTVQATTGWAGYDLHKCKVCGHSYKDNEKAKLASHEFPKGYSDGTCTIIIYKEWYENAYVYAAHVTFSDYDRLWIECGNGKYNSGGETTSHAAKRVGAILAINGDYAVPGNGAGGYAIARRGVVYNDKKAYPEGVYNSNTGRLTFGHSGKMLSELVAAGEVTDTFQFGPVFLKNGSIIGDKNSSSRAQRTFIGTNGNAGDIWLCVSDGRYNDGKSAGLNAYECGAYLASKGCTLGVPLDGGGSSTMYFNGSVLNAAKSGQRAVVDFLVFK
ncbi:MAG: phosphodiester glycosidase family protein [Agathobacter sp.]|nr:phosphodiester glycosidase family protein [Agathobacter sp.]